MFSILTHTAVFFAGVILSEKVSNHPKVKALKQWIRTFVRDNVR